MKRTGLASICLLLSLLPIGAGACSCLQTSTKEAEQKADIVFRGKLLRHGRGTAVFRVDEQWKGNLRSTVALEWREGDHGDCNGFWSDLLNVGNDLLVFATRGSDGVYRTGICWPTKLVAKAANDLQELRPGRPPPPEKNHSPVRTVIYVIIGLAFMFGVPALRRRRRRYSR